MSKPTTSRPPSRRRAALAAVVVLAIGPSLTACSGDDEPPAESPSESESLAMPTNDPVEFEVATRTKIGRVVGRWPKKEHDRLVATVGPVVQKWFNAAYGGSYPRSDFGDAFPGFTARAEREAKRDKVLLTNIGIGDRLTAVTPTESRIWLDVLAVRKKAVGVTARFLLKFKTEGDVEKHVRVKGRLMLNRHPSGWRIFGYDVAKGARK